MVFPALARDVGRPALGAADIYAMFNDRPEVRALLEYLTLPMSVSGFLNTSGALAVQNGATADMYANPVDGDIGTALAAATSFRFDGSDLMPGEVGAGSFWTGVTDWASGAAELDLSIQHRCIAAMIDIALREDLGPVSLTDVASRQQISLAYLEAVSRISHLHRLPH